MYAFETYKYIFNGTFTTIVERKAPFFIVDGKSLALRAGNGRLLLLMAVPLSLLLCR